MTRDERDDAAHVGMMLALDFLGIPDGAPVAFALYDWGRDELENRRREGDFSYPVDETT